VHCGVLDNVVALEIELDRLIDAARL